MNTKKIIITTAGKTSILPCADIVVCKADGSYTHLQFLDENERLLISKSLKQVMEMLDVPYIIRISQSISVNADYVKYLHHREKEVELVNGEKFRYTINLKELEKSIQDALQQMGVSRQGEDNGIIGET
ncbi:LytTR family DNA-binding domain-containing protein [Parapedobacter tibetensis]|uniref:LytTR family DNA-binding domain-containing protein n=1 Tax=Parapedobacter tibetensis TaxID=2972951 RepID=UPI00214D5AA5|nr:LytTR family DNA-binding domain-containing protein [Parapedobacter tibetensis]